MLPPVLLCRQHLLGEHNELHMLVGSINRGISVQGYLDRGLIEPQNIHNRHEAIVYEMLRRGYNHRSPLPPITVAITNGHVHMGKSISDLVDRCPTCRDIMRAIIND